MFISQDHQYNRSGLNMRLEQHLLESEATRKNLETRFQQLSQASYDTEQRRLNNLKQKYSDFIKGERDRSERNCEILKSLQKLETSANIVFAKTERLKQLRNHFDAYLSRAVPLWRHPEGLDLSSSFHCSLGTWAKDPPYAPLTRPALLIPGEGAVIIPVMGNQIRESFSNSPSPNKGIGIASLGEAGLRMMRELSLVEGTLPHSPQHSSLSRKNTSSLYAADKYVGLDSDQMILKKFNEDSLKRNIKSNTHLRTSEDNLDLRRPQHHSTQAIGAYSVATSQPFRNENAAMIHRNSIKELKAFIGDEVSTETSYDTLEPFASRREELAEEDVPEEFNDDNNEESRDARQHNISRYVILEEDEEEEEPPYYHGSWSQTHAMPPSNLQTLQPHERLQENVHIRKNGDQQLKGPELNMVVQQADSSSFAKEIEYFPPPGLHPNNEQPSSRFHKPQQNTHNKQVFNSSVSPAQSSSPLNKMSLQSSHQSKEENVQQQYLQDNTNWRNNYSNTKSNLSEQEDKRTQVHSRQYQEQHQRPNLSKSMNNRNHIEPRYNIDNLAESITPKPTINHLYGSMHDQQYADEYDYTPVQSGNDWQRSQSQFHPESNAHSSHVIEQCQYETEPENPLPVDPEYFPHSVMETLQDMPSDAHNQQLEYVSNDNTQQQYNSPGPYESSAVPYENQGPSYLMPYESNQHEQSEHLPYHTQFENNHSSSERHFEYDSVPEHHRDEIRHEDILHHNDFEKDLSPDYIMQYNNSNLISESQNVNDSHFGMTDDSQCYGQPYENSGPFHEQQPEFDREVHELHDGYEHYDTHYVENNPDIHYGSDIAPQFLENMEGYTPSYENETGPDHATQYENTHHSVNESSPSRQIEQNMNEHLEKDVENLRNSYIASPGKIRNSPKAGQFDAMPPAAVKSSVINQLLDSESESYRVEPASGSQPDDSDFDLSISKQ